MIAWGFLGFIGVGLFTKFIEGRARYRTEGGQIMEYAVQLISDVGFPIVVTMYLLYRIESKLDTLITTMETLPRRISEEQTLKQYK